VAAAVQAGGLVIFADGKAVISGMGQSDVGRRLGRDGIDLAVEGTRLAIEDAGLSVDDIDGVASYPGPVQAEAGFAGAGTHDVRDALGIRTRWFTSGLETPGQLGPVMYAASAVACGLADHVVCFRSVFESTGQAAVGRAAALSQHFTRATGHTEYRMPFGAASAANWIAMYAERYMSEHGLTREQLAQIALNARRNAARNPKAIYTAPMTMEEYLSVRMISEPLCLYDCDVPCDGATVVIVSRREATAGLRRSPLTINAVGTALYERHTWDQRTDLTTMAAHDAAAAMWDSTDLSPGDVNFAMLYDGFSYLTLEWLEALRFCEHGRAGRFIEGGERISPEGSLPVNTHGGQLSAGRLHGFGFLHEACVQLWGEGGQRQLSGEPSVGAVGVGGGPEGGCLLLTRES
jgi:acetyl-CoA acetyltransferase